MIYGTNLLHVYRKQWEDGGRDRHIISKALVFVDKQNFLNAIVELTVAFPPNSSSSVLVPVFKGQVTYLKSVLTFPVIFTSFPSTSYISLRRFFIFQIRQKEMRPHEWNVPFETFASLKKQPYEPAVHLLSHISPTGDGSSAIPLAAVSLSRITREQ